MKFSGAPSEIVSGTLKNSAARSASTEGAKGRKGSLNLIFVLTDFLHIRDCRIGEDAAVAERSRPPFKPTLHPANDSARGQPVRNLIQKVVLIINTGKC